MLPRTIFLKLLCQILLQLRSEALLFVMMMMAIMLMLFLLYNFDTKVCEDIRFKLSCHDLLLG